MARNRKRANQRRARRPSQASSPRRGIPTATHEPVAPREVEPEDNGALEHDRPDAEAEDNGAPGALEQATPDAEAEDNGVPGALEHATPDTELADAQLAYGRPEEPEPGDAADEEEFDLEVEESIEAGDGREPGAPVEEEEEEEHEEAGEAPRDGRGALATRTAAHPEHRVTMLSRLIGFLQGSWRELQRVQWPDRRQVMQATGVVIGFVIVAAVFLGVADWVAGKIVTFVLK